VSVVALGSGGAARGGCIGDGRDGGKRPPRENRQVAARGLGGWWRRAGAAMICAAG